MAEQRKLSVQIREDPYPNSILRHKFNQIHADLIADEISGLWREKNRTLLCVLCLPGRSFSEAWRLCGEKFSFQMST